MNIFLKRTFCLLKKKVEVYLVHGVVARALNANIDHRILEGAAHVVLEGEIVNTLKRKSSFNCKSQFSLQSNML